MVAGLVQDLVDVVVVVDDHHGEVSVTGVGEGERGFLRDVDHGEGVERVPVLADDRLVVDRRRFAMMVSVFTPPACCSSDANIRSVSARAKLSTLTVVTGTTFLRTRLLTNRAVQHGSGSDEVLGSTRHACIPRTGGWRPPQGHE